MKYNLDPAFAGLDELKRTHAAQIADFERWAASDDWQRFHSSHYDWWTFPINRRSSYGARWTVYEGEVAALKQDPAFITRYLRGVELVALAWGWDLARKTYLAQPKPGQSWHDWPIRLFKAAQSLQLFGYDEQFTSLRRYALDLMRDGQRMEYNGKDLSWLFTARDS
jgi:hypothetical protein